MSSGSQIDTRRVPNHRTIIRKKNQLTIQINIPRFKHQRILKLLFILQQSRFVLISEEHRSVVIHILNMYNKLGGVPIASTEVVSGFHCQIVCGYEFPVEAVPACLLHGYYTGDRVKVEPGICIC